MHRWLRSCLVTLFRRMHDTQAPPSRAAAARLLRMTPTTARDCYTRPTVLRQVTCSNRTSFTTSATILVTSRSNAVARRTPSSSGSCSRPEDKTTLQSPYAKPTTCHDTWSPPSKLTTTSNSSRNRHELTSTFTTSRIR